VRSMQANASFALTGLRCNVRFATSGRFCQIVSVKEKTTHLVFLRAADFSAAFFFLAQVHSQFLPLPSMSALYCVNAAAPLAISSGVWPVTGTVRMNELSKLDLRVVAYTVLSTTVS